MDVAARYELRKAAEEKLRDELRKRFGRKREGSRAWSREVHRTVLKGV